MPWYVSALIYAIGYAAFYVLKKYKAIKRFELLDTVLVEVVIAAGFVFLLIQLVTGHNPNYVLSAIIIGVVVVCIQILFYRVMKPQWMKILPFVVALGWLAWGKSIRLLEKWFWFEASF